MKNKKGFTLIELLAVIVVLAIVMVLAVTSVLPYMADAKKEAFAIEGEAGKDAAASAMRLIEIKKFDSSFYSYDSTNNVYCFTAYQLASAGLIKKENNNYKGIVKVYAPVDVSKAYRYEVQMTNGSLWIKQDVANGNYGEITKADVNENYTNGNIATTCS